MIEQAKKLNKSAIREIYLTYKDAVFNLAFRITGERAVAQDVMQESFIKVIDKIQSYKGTGTFASWLKRIVVNQAISKLRFEDKFEPGCVSDGDELISTDLFNANWIEASMDLTSLLARLNDTMRAVFWLHEVEGLDHKEIAVLFNKTDSFSKVNLMRAYQKLKQLAHTTDMGERKCI